MEIDVLSWVISQSHIIQQYGIKYRKQNSEKDFDLGSQGVFDFSYLVGTTRLKYILTFLVGIVGFYFYFYLLLTQRSLNIILIFLLIMRIFVNVIFQVIKTALKIVMSTRYEVP